MQKSFKQRLAALEALEARAELDHSPLTEDDRQMLYQQIAMSNVQLDARGRLVRSWAVGDAAATTALDQALARCNAALLGLVPRLTTLRLTRCGIRPAVHLSKPLTSCARCFSKRWRIASLKKRLDALERAAPHVQPAYVLLVPDDEGRLIGPGGQVWEDNAGVVVTDLDVPSVYN